MKSLRFQLFLFCAFFLGQNTVSLAQAVSEKKLQGGVTGSVGLNFPKMGTNLLGSSPGFSSSFGVSFTKVSKESQNIALSGGVEFDIDRISYNVSDQDVFYRFTDKHIKPNQRSTLPCAMVAVWAPRLAKRATVRSIEGSVLARCSRK
jgi:hypothetical protein